MPSYKFIFVMEPHQRDRVKNRARVEGVSMAAVLRDIIDAELPEEAPVSKRRTVKRRIVKGSGR